MKIIVTGPKSAGKTTVSRHLADLLDVPVIDVDDIIEQLYYEQQGTKKVCREIYRELGAEGFRGLELSAVCQAAERDWCVIATGGSSMLKCGARRALRPNAIWVYLEASVDTLWPRLTQAGLPAYLEKHDDPQKTFGDLVGLIHEVIEPRCDVRVPIGDCTPEALAEVVCQEVALEMACRAEAPNTFGDVIRLTTFGESHGPMMGAVLDGVKPGIALEAADIQADLDRRRPGQSAISTPRKEKDQVEICSGVFEGRTTGAPISLLIRNADSKSKHYDGLREVFRPGHADFTFWRKYGIRDHRGGGRSSGRETASRVAGGAVARKILAERGVNIRAWTMQIGAIKAATVDRNVIESNPVRCPDTDAARKMEQAILDAKDRQDSLGGLVQVEVTGLPPGLGDPVFGKLDARIGKALFSLGAVKGVEFGSGFGCVAMPGSEHNDPMHDNAFDTNNAGGVMGGISTGQPLCIRVGVKPTPSIAQSQQTCDIHGANRDIAIEGRHDPCIVPRIIPVIEAMLALLLLDVWEIQDRIRPDWMKKSDEQGQNV